MSTKIYDQFLQNCIPREGLGTGERPILKILVVGNSGAGKTTFITRQTTGQFVKEYVPTPGATIQGIQLHVTSETYIGDVLVLFYEMGGDKVWRECHQAALSGMDGAILMTDSNKRVKYWLERVKKYSGDIPVILCSTKNDIEPSAQRITEYLAELVRANLGKYLVFEISSRSNYNFEKPVLWLLRRCLGLKDLVIQ